MFFSVCLVGLGGVTCIDCAIPSELLGRVHSALPLSLNDDDDDGGWIYMMNENNPSLCYAGCVETIKRFTETERTAPSYFPRSLEGSSTPLNLPQNPSVRLP